MRSSIARFLAAAAIACAAASGGAASPTGGAPRGDKGISEFPESSALRSRYWASFFAAPIPALLARPPAVVAEGPNLFRLYALSQGDYVYAIAAALGPGPVAGAAEAPLYAQGTWIVKRARDGRFVQAKVFLRSDPGAFARIYPDGDRSRLDIVLYGGVIARQAPIALPFERVCASGMAQIVSWTSSLASWPLLEPRPGLYRDTREFVAALRSRLGSLAYAEDGALDSSGSPVYIATGAPQKKPYGLNCSGFAKWVVDGLYGPLAGAWLDPREMAARHAEARNGSLSEAVEEELDPYFGLDWTRNLASALAGAGRPGPRPPLQAQDVREAPFALLEAGTGMGPEAAAVSRVPGGSVPDGGEYAFFPSYKEGVGFPTAGLRPLLYALAMREPGTAYLASLSRTGGEPLPGLRRHYHVAVLVPYFGEDGAFEIAVFESAAETSLEALVARTGGDYAHLVRVKASRDFEPPPFPAD